MALAYYVSTLGAQRLPEVGGSGGLVKRPILSGISNWFSRRAPLGEEKGGGGGRGGGGEEGGEGGGGGGEGGRGGGGGGGEKNLCTLCRGIFSPLLLSNRIPPPLLSHPLLLSLGRRRKKREKA